MTTTLASLPWNTSPITDEATWRAYMRLARGTGVIPEDPADPEVLNGFLVYADSTGMQVKIKSGTAWMRGVYAPNPAEVIEAISAAHATLNRIDRVALKLDTVNHTVAITVVTGTPGASPVAPTLTNTTSIYYVKLAQVYVTAAVTTIAADKVTDERSYSVSSSDLARIAGVVLATDAANIDFSSIPGIYRNLKIVFMGRVNYASVSQELRMQINGDAGSTYSYQYMKGIAAAVSAAEAILTTSILLGSLPASNGGSSLAGSAEILIPNYAGTTFRKTIHAQVASQLAYTTGNLEVVSVAGFWANAAAINRVTIFPAAGNFLAGSLATLYGLM